MLLVFKLDASERLPWIFPNNSIPCQWVLWNPGNRAAPIQNGFWMSMIRPTGDCIQGRACRRRLFLAPLSGHAMQHEHIFMCSTIYPGFSSMWSVGFYQVLCTAPFTPASLSVQHHALSWQKGSSFEHKALLHMPMWDLLSLLFLAPAICKLHYCAVERKIPFPSSPMHAMQLEKRKSKQFSLDQYSNVYFTCIVITRPFSGVLIDNLSRLVLADVRFACLIYMHAFEHFWCCCYLESTKSLDTNLSLYLFKKKKSLSLRVGVSAAQCVESAVTAVEVAVLYIPFAFGCPSLPARQSLNFESLKPDKIYLHQQ